MPNSATRMTRPTGSASKRTAKERMVSQETTAKTTEMTRRRKKVRRQSSPWRRSNCARRSETAGPLGAALSFAGGFLEVGHEFARTRPASRIFLVLDLTRSFWNEAGRGGKKWIRPSARTIPVLIPYNDCRTEKTKPALGDNQAPVDVSIERIGWRVLQPVDTIRLRRLRRPRFPFRGTRSRRLPPR